MDEDPSFRMGPDQQVDEDAGRRKVRGWATNITAGPNEPDQTVTFILTADNPGLFSTQPRLTPTGSLVYAPAKDADGSSKVTVAISDHDGDAGPDRATGDAALPSFRISVRPVNDAPKAAADAAATTDRAGGVDIDVLSNDTDAGYRLRVAHLGQPGHGSVTEKRDGTFTYVPDGGFSGEDGSRYTVSDGKDTASVTVTVRDPTAPEVDGTTRFLRILNDERTMRVGIVFSESMNPSAFDGRTFTLTARGANRPVAAQVRYDERTKSVLLTPNRLLERGVRYTARVEGGRGASRTSRATRSRRARFGRSW